MSANTLPHDIYSASTLPHEDSFLLIGGSNRGEILKTVYRFEAAEETFVLMEGVNFQTEQLLSEVMYVDAQAFPKC